MTGAQKCTVLKPMGLSHMRLNQPACWAACCSALAVDCHLRPHCCRCWLRNACWKPEAREKACRVWAAADAEEKSGREARVKAAAEEDMAESLLLSLSLCVCCGINGLAGQRRYSRAERFLDDERGGSGRSGELGIVLAWMLVGLV